MSYSYNSEDSSEESRSFYTVSGNVTPVPTMAQPGNTNMTEEGASSQTQSQRTLEGAYSALAAWLGEPMQGERRKTHTLAEGPLAPLASSNIWFDTEMFNTILTTYYRGAQAASDSTIKGPEVSTNFPGSAIPILWDYYNQGFRCASDAKNNKSNGSKTTSTKLPDPEKFDGRRDKLEGFIKRLYLKFNNEQERFPDDTRKIVYAIHFLSSDARTWADPYIDKDTGAIAFNSWTEFVTGLRKSFGDPNRIATAEFEIENLKQDGSIDLYYSKFKELMEVLEWSERQKVFRFRTGLKAPIRDQLVNRGQYTNETSFEQLYINARNAENDLNIRSQENRSFSGNHQSKGNTRKQHGNKGFIYQPSQGAGKQSGNSTAYGTHSGPMDLNAASRRPANSKSNREYPKLTQAEREQRYKKGQCFYCKAEGHYASACPVAKKKGNNQGNSNWKKPDTRKAFPASTTEGTSGVEKGKVVYSLGGKEESKN